MNIFQQVADFNEKIPGLPRAKHLKMLEANRKQWTIDALREELHEFADAASLEEEADALIDLIYFAVGRLPEMGVNGAACFQAVHEANMKKVRGKLSKRPHSRGYDAVKPEGWEPPDLSAVMGRKRVCVLGYGRHGKDTLAEMIMRRRGEEYIPTSMLIAEHIVMPAVPWKYETVQECFDDRHRGDNRKQWYNLVARFNRRDPARFAKLVYSKSDMYCGLRSAAEFAAAQKAGLFDAILWIDRSKHEEAESADSCTVHPAFADYHIDNNGCLEDLELQVARLETQGVL